ncbi:hypothetical protein V2G26_002219 [Clonostachys chloroleuca]|uniref:Peptidase S1 domain-containing protein n=1 Tax=Clonostachys rhizophaga TaxID=160324 RepID=A0A9N9YIN4_9HYPO|nr:unnamed protein product [Clonostachys rhizophaga]
MKSSVLALLPALAAAKPVPDVGISTVNVVGGQEASATEFPFIVSLESKTEGEEGHYCGGTLLNSLTVLTAAHCLASEDAENVQIRAGHRIRNEGGVTVNAASIWLHPDYNATSAENDLALVQLEEPIEKTNNITYATLSPPKSDPKAGTQVTVAGWGHTSEGGELADTLQKASFPVIDRAECKKTLDANITEGMFCAGDLKGGIDSCQGDSGGPLLNDENGNVIGVVSFGFGCARENSPGVYARVGYYRELINSKMWKPAVARRFFA